MVWQKNSSGYCEDMEKQMEIEVRTPKKVNAKTLHLYCKVADMFTAYLRDSAGNIVAEQDDGYVPSFMPGEHHGDYIILDIDIETGQITNWKKPMAHEYQEWVDKLNEDQ